MKKLILHIGFPKCASTTLQESLFFNLNNQDFNFLGRSRGLNKSNNYVIGNDLKSNPKLLKIDSNSFREGINIISDELLLIPNSLWNLTKRGKENHAAFLNNEFNKFVDETIILIVLRKQEEWIYSNYSFKYASLRDLKIYISYDDLINNLKSDNDLFKEFEYGEYIDPYSKSFGKENLKFLFVEEFGNIDSHSINELAGLFNMDKRDVFELLQQQKNVQQKEEIMTKSSYRFKRLRSHLNLRSHKPSRNTLSFLKNTYELPNVTNPQKEEVFQLYKQFNREFAASYGLSEIMNDLKYF